MENALERKMRRYTCPLCGRSIRVPEKYVGQTGACKLCGGRITITENEALAAPRKNEARQAPRAEQVQAAATVPSPRPVPQRAVPAPAHEPFLTPPPEMEPPAVVEEPAIAAAEMTLAPGNSGTSPSERVFERDRTVPKLPGESSELAQIESAPVETLIQWIERLPHSTLSIREIDEIRGTPTFLSDDELAKSKAYFDVPFLISRKAEALVIAKTTQDNVGPGTSQAVASGDLEFEAIYHSEPEYPILQLLFTVNDHPERPLRFESLPLLTDGNVSEFAVTALKERRIVFALYAGSQNHHVATGEIALDQEAIGNFAQALARALRQWHEGHPKAAGHDIAAARFAREHPLRSG